MTNQAMQTSSSSHQTATNSPAMQQYRRRLERVLAETAPTAAGSSNGTASAVPPVTTGGDGEETAEQRFTSYPWNLYSFEPSQPSTSNSSNQASTSSQETAPVDRPASGGDGGEGEETDQPQTPEPHFKVTFSSALMAPYSARFDCFWVQTPLRPLPKQRQITSKRFTRSTAAMNVALEQPPSWTYEST